jgi:hypothetical protein
MNVYNKILRIFRKQITKTMFGPDEYGCLYDYYKQQYLTDLEEFKNACKIDKKTGNKLFFVQDLDSIIRSRHPLLGKKHFLYFLVIHTALLMEVHKYFPKKYVEFQKVNKGIVFEYGLTNTFIHPWNILERLNVPFNQELFSSCIGWVISQLMTDYYFCGIIPQDFMDKFINDPDLNSNRTLYGKNWKELCANEWIEIITSTCPKIK